MKKDGVLDTRVLLGMVALAFALGLSADSDKILKKKEPIAASGEHLVLDMKGVDKEFLESEERLVKAMEDTLTKLDRSLLSCNCHFPTKKIISCVGVLAGAHMSLYAWPEYGVIALDFFNEGPQSLIPAVDVMKDFFEIGQGVESFWSVDYRGDNEKYLQPLAGDVVNSLIGKVKKEILSVRTKNHQVDVWEIMDIDATIIYEDSIAHKLMPGDPRWLSNELARVVTDISIDGMNGLSNDSDSSLEREFEVLPALITHSNPKHIAIGKNLSMDKIPRLVLSF
jgi:S-adenosylmethionine/arginine decarboxylase-like enzyme